ncbi:hypothetical protein JOF48_000563 [Arthrobacter stackebrandtii]|uniref:Uncharacterized protein n=1 Tax=Arthrobacter stackebrandtii TaxID=272161 RepID=A0ABS4YSQ3_9MICC|nr:hypothetical protein [Arthrobacter stackebrandtii]MBP2411764.1 hypothetical protein [Arthrobacter stackebrandtii]
MTLIPVASPRFWWRTTPTCVQLWVDSDPDIDDGQGPRWQDRDHQRWARIAAVVAQVGEAIAAGEWMVDPEMDGYGLVQVQDDLSDLTKTERHIIKKWFSASQAVRFDPWFVPLTDGRHRLWATLPYFGSSLVPICGDALDYATPGNAEALGSGRAYLFSESLGQLDSVTWFDLSDPANQRFRAGLVEAAEGGFPSQI